MCGFASRFSHFPPASFFTYSFQFVEKEEEGKEDDDDSNQLINFLICKVWKVSHSP